MSLLITIICIILLLLTCIAFKIVVYPQIQIFYFKNKYGKDVEVLYHFGSGLLQEFKQSLEKEGDSFGRIRKIMQINPDAQAIIHNNASGKMAYSFIDPDLIKQVHQQPEYFEKQIAHPAIISLFSKSILYLSGKKWQKQRQFFGKSFHFDEIRNYLPVIKQTSQDVFSSIKQSLNNSLQQEVQVVKTCEKVTSEVVVKVFFGSTSQNIIVTRSDGTKLPVAQELIEIMVDSFRVFRNSKFAFVKFLLLRQRSFQILPTQSEKDLAQRIHNAREECNQIIQDRKQQLLNDPTQFKSNFLDMYLKEIIINKNEDIKEEYIIDNFLALLFAGTDTTGNMTGAAFYYLSLNTDIQSRAREEIISILNRKGQQNNTEELYNSMTFEDIANLNLINSILKESLRLIPPAAAVFPRRVIKDIKIGNFQLKKGDAINTQFICNHYNPQIYKNPDIFDPNRWMEQKEQNLFNFTPFSLGPRNCIGQHLAMIEGKCMIAYVLLNFEIIPNHEVQVKKEIKLTYGLLPDNLVYFKKRQQI
nr:cytochrome P450 monooxygenase CYP5005A15 [Tetrahymena thermophila]